MNIAILGAGAWGTALAASLGERNCVTLWTRERAHADEMRKSRANSQYLPGIPLPERIEICDDWLTAVAGNDLVIIATPTSGLREVAGKLHNDGFETPVLWACKGFDKDTGDLPHETIAKLQAGKTMRQFAYGALSGPSFALEVAQGLPTALTLAMREESEARRLAALLNGGNLRVYSSVDLVGVELGGALKNVMAIAAGISDGMQLGMNARAALITRGLAEMTRLGVAMGARAETFMGLTGLGDLVLTATGGLSRNRSVGLQLAEGKSLADILASLGHVAEGVNTAATARRRARELGIELPIAETVAAILFDGADPRESVKRLMARDPKAE
ncbi:MAG: NAD(P)-dependent glycerol-3-phosphate dehydrogenase [Betaproteobacteria bacterium]|nr:NAD(P)-dependent glycerol-3-phosphate dehydrogenase [Betaproteobacteria bacterium]